MGTLIVGVLVFGLLALAAYKTYQDRKKGKGCGCGCEGCGNCPDHAEADTSSPR